jgi:anaerobic ribonucleoside-triphosphate reductase activating protein
MDLTYLRINSYLESSLANGPGDRFVVWLQGCKKNCEGCFNQHMKDFSRGYDISIDALFKLINSTDSADGVTFSGGEPFEQSESLNLLLTLIKHKTNKSILVFTGFSKEEIECDPVKNFLLKNIDVLISGEYKIKLKQNHPLLSSSNQELHLLSHYYCIKDICCPDSEIIISCDGKIKITGTSPLLDQNND